MSGRAPSTWPASQASGAPPDGGRRRRLSVKAWIGIAFLILVVLVAAAGGTAFLMARGALEAPSSGSPRPVAIQVARSETVDQVASDLQSHGLIRDSFWFGMYAGFKGLASRMESGRHLLAASMTASEIVARLESAPDVVIAKVVLTEGMTAQQMAAAVVASGVHISVADYMAQVKQGSFDQAFLAGRPAGASLEGFLFPDTYSIPVDSTARQVVQMQLDDFARKAYQLLQASGPDNLGLYQVVTVASLIEREARFADDQPQVASVIYNRLASNMNLDLDASVLYGLGVNGRAPTQAELQQDTPYNTYLHAGLPPTPISNPGTAAVTAAAHPAATPYLYYVSDPSGHNHYSATAAQHQQQCLQYLGTSC